MLSSEVSGFFAEYYLKIRNSFTEADISRIAAFNNDYDRMKFIENVEVVRHEDIKIQHNFDGKDASIASVFKEKGNQAFKAKQWLDAMILYSKGYVAVPADHRVDKALLLANRSATLYHLSKFDEALLDIQRSLDHGYPSNLIYKLYEREARCYLAKKNYSSALLSFKKTVSTLDDADITPDKRSKMKIDAIAMITMLEKDRRTKLQKTNSSDITDALKNPKEKPFTSVAIKFDQNKDEGRFAKAIRDIKVGEEILVEHAFAAVLLEKFSKSHCACCFHRTVIPVACPTCADVVYCSEKCLQSAFEQFHQFECGLLRTIWKSGASVNCHLALRIILSQPLDYFKTLRDMIDNPMPLEELRKLPKTDYRCVSHLVRHEDKRSPSNFFQHCLMARFLVKCLESTSYFGGSKDPEDVLYISSLILRNLQFIQFNTHEISELLNSNNNQNKRTLFIGGGLYPTLALFNHSCDPGITRYFSGSTVHVNTIKSIESGLPISENYGPIYTQEKREERQAKLKDLYWFDCSCDACLENWPRLEDMKLDTIRFRCDGALTCPGIIEVPANCNDFMVKCVKCGQITNIFKGLKVMQDTEQMSRAAKQKYDLGRYSEALNKFIDLLKIMNQVLAPPFPDYCQCQQNIKDCFLHLGNVYEME